jgi:delta-aminolevulinic acid dehydratase/porphobilinogen synthase
MIKQYKHYAPLSLKTKDMFPLQRGRRLRVNESIRSLVRETTLSPSDFMFPMFIAEGENTSRNSIYARNFAVLSI